MELKLQKTKSKIYLITPKAKQEIHPRTWAAFSDFFADLSANQEQLKEVLEANNFYLAYEKVMHRLDRSDLTEAEVIAFLGKKGFSKNCAQAVLTELKNKNYVSNERYTELFIKLKSSKYSNRIIEARLLEKGVARKTIQDAFLKIQYDEEKTLSKQIDKKLTQITGPFLTYKSKTIAHFIRKGFSADLVERLVLTKARLLKYDEKKSLEQDYRKVFAKFALLCSDRKNLQKQTALTLIKKGYLAANIKIVEQNLASEF